MLSVEEARQRMLDTIPILPSEKREILECTGYVLAEALPAKENIPPFDNSAMDGYAVRAVRRPKMLPRKILPCFQL